jgi:predicted MFS family arabinose efflux permease
VNRNIKVLLAVSVLFGAATGIYEFVLPYYLAERGLSFQNMGAIFAIAAAGTLLLRILFGRLADLRGRKPFYGLTLGASAAALGLTPLTASVAGQSALKTIRDAMYYTRESLHPVVLYEESRGRFMDFLGKTRGMEFLFMAAGTLLAGWFFTTWGTHGNLWAGALMLGAGFLLFWLLFRERADRPRRASDSLPLRALLSLHMHPNLIIIMISVFIFNIGMTTSHCFIMPLFFSEKFGVSEYAVSWVMLLHRLTIALPLLLAGSLRIRRLKAVYIGALAFEGTLLSASALIPHFHPAAAVWLLHDLLGAGLWIPVQGLLIQQHTHPETRALTVGKLMAYGGIGTIIGPWLAGHLSQHLNISAPFFASGLLLILAALALLPLRLPRQHT